ncbi:DUF4446 family protein [Candidatus Microgenomates bacterium]|nr:MAG: DUF4446 family protein [Candidatus Microgenomates bacterium]
MTPTVVYVLLGILFVWLGVVSFFIFRAIANYNRLTNGITGETLSQLLQQFVTQHKEVGKQQTELTNKLREVSKVAESGIQKIGLVRYNPFSDTGGDQSFTIALLDGAENGLVITSLYARSGTRWYTKTIKHGKAVEVELSQEEKQALKKALSKKG